MLSRRTLLRQAGVLAVAGGGLWLLRDRVLWPAPRPAFAPGKGGGSGWLDLAPGVAVPVVDAMVNGERVRALVDSGAQATVVDKELAQRLKLTDALSAPMIAFGVSGGPQTGRGARLEVTLGELTLPGLHAAALDLSPLGALRGFGPPVALVIGQDVLRTVLLDLDLPHDRLAFHPREGGREPPGLRAVPARSRGREQWTHVVVEGLALEVAVDTGLSSALALSEDLARQAGLLAEGRPVRRTRSVTLGGASDGREVLAETLELGGHTLRRAPVAVYPRGRASLIPEGLLGSGAFRRTRALLDLGAGRLLVGSPGVELRLERRASVVASE